mgnify:CR=1 FL=1
MAIFGLGNFGEGFVEGLATSANKALQDDIKRINLRAEKVADFQVKRTVEAQEKRKKDLEEIEDALREAEGLFDKDDPRAAAYAASLLEEQGSASALKAFTKQIKESNVYKSGQSLANFIEMAEKDMPTGTRSDYANAFLGAPSLPTDYRLPESAASAGAGNLLDAIGLKPDVSAMVSEQVSEQMSAMGIAEQAEITVSLPSGTFMKEKFTLGNKTPSERLKYLNEQLANENNTPERISELQGMLIKAQNAAFATGSDQTKLESLQSQLSRAEGDEATKLEKQIQELKRTINLKAARSSKNPLDILEAEEEIALAKAIETGNDADMDKVREIRKKKRSYGPEQSPEDLLKEAEDAFVRDVTSGAIKKDTPEYNAKVEELQTQRDIIDDAKGKNKIGDITGAELNTARKILSGRIDLDLANKIPAEDREKFKQLQTALEVYQGNISSLKETDPDLYDQYMDFNVKYGDIVKQSIASVLADPKLQNQEVLKNELELAASVFYSYGGVAQAAASKAKLDTAEGNVTVGGEEPVVGGEDAVVDAASAENLKKKFSDDEAGATKMVNAILTKGINMEAAIADAKAKGYSPAFISVLEQNKGVDSTIAKMAIEDAGMQTDKDETTQVMDIVDRFHSTALAPNFVAQPSKVNRLVRKALGLGDTDKDKQRASEIIEQVRIKLVERDRKPKDINRRASRTGRASGGLMSRG